MVLNVTYQNTYYFCQHFNELKKTGNEFEVKGEPTWFWREIFTPCPVSNFGDDPLVLSSGTYGFSMTKDEHKYFLPKFHYRGWVKKLYWRF